MHKTHKDMTLPEANEIFVFGSNLGGMHGAGAAKVAKEKYGAEWGVGIGKTGNSYAIPTKDKVLDRLDLKTIKEHVDEFVKYVEDHPELNFFITRIGCVLAGFRDMDIAPMFQALNGKENCSFPDQWDLYLKLGRILPKQTWFCLFKDGTADWYDTEMTPPARPYVTMDDYTEMVLEKDHRIKHLEKQLDELGE